MYNDHLSQCEGSLNTNREFGIIQCSGDSSEMDAEILRANVNQPFSNSKVKSYFFIGPCNPGLRDRAQNFTGLRNEESARTNTRGGDTTYNRPQIRLAARELGRNEL